LQEAHGPGHVKHWNAFRDGNDYADARVSRLHDRIGSSRRWDEDHRRIRLGLPDGLGHGVEQVKVILDRAALAGGYTAYHLGAVSATLSRVERARLAHTLAQHSRLLVY